MLQDTDYIIIAIFESNITILTPREKVFLRDFE